MIVLGLTGGIDATHENVYDFPFDFIHDSAAVLVPEVLVPLAAWNESERIRCRIDWASVREALGETLMATESFEVPVGVPVVFCPCDW